MSVLHRVRQKSRRTQLAVLTGCVVLVLAALAAVLVPLATGSDEAAPCHHAPKSARALAQDPERAAAALDPGDAVSRTAPLKRLIGTSGAPLCDGEEDTKLAGRALVAATTGRTYEDRNRPARPHTERGARVMHATVQVLGKDPRDLQATYPVGLAPYVARALAGYIEDLRRDLVYSSHDDWQHPVASSEEAEYSDGSGNWASAYPRPGEQHAVLSERGNGTTQLNAVLSRLTVSPQAFALLYDAERAYFTYYLERLGKNAEEPDAKGKYALSRTEAELSQSARLIAGLMRMRAAHVQAGRVPDLAAYDKAVLRHTRGTYRTAPRRVTGTPPPAGALSQRRPDGPAPGKGARAAERLMDGRVQLFATYDRWARERHVDPVVADRLRTKTDTDYARGLATR